jgi:hypothetical protein
MLSAVKTMLLADNNKLLIAQCYKLTTLCYLHYKTMLSADNTKLSADATMLYLVTCYQLFFLIFTRSFGIKPKRNVAFFYDFYIKIWFSHRPEKDI